MTTTLSIQKPAMKWVGNKQGTAVADRVAELFAPYRDSHLWVEPFVGIGGMLLSINPDRALCMDASPEIVGLHQWIQDGGYWAWIDSLDSEETYYAARAKFNELQSQYLASPDFIEDKDEFFSLMIWLNKACYNGLWRVNQSGFFNVPVGRKGNGELHNPSRPELPKYKPEWLFGWGDWRSALSYKMCDGDCFVYHDPPYSGTHTAYTANGFSSQDQYDLAAWAKSCPHPVVISNSLEMAGCYDAIGLKVELIEVPRSINQDGTKRGKVTEVLARNF